MDSKAKDNSSCNESEGSAVNVAQATKRILVVDDERAFVVLISKMLTTAGYEVIIANDGQEGLDKAKSQKPDLIVLDLMLPRLNGYKVCGFLKNDTSYAKIPIIMLTSKTEAKDIELGREIGADAYVTKPYKRNTLLSKIEELLKE